MKLNYTFTMQHLTLALKSAKGMSKLLLWLEQCCQEYQLVSRHCSHGKNYCEKTFRRSPSLSRPCLICCINSSDHDTKLRTALRFLSSNSTALTFRALEWYSGMHRQILGLIFPLTLKAFVPWLMTFHDYIVFFEDNQCHSGNRLHSPIVCGGKYFLLR